jgi:hypothetical protein
MHSARVSLRPNCRPSHALLARFAPFSFPLTPGTSSRILWVNGGVDPWHFLSLLPQENQNPANAAIVIPSGAHCRAMQPSRDSDPADVKAARLAAAAVLDGWLAAADEQGASLAAGAAAALRPAAIRRK